LKEANRLKAAAAAKKAAAPATPVVAAPVDPNAWTKE